MHCAAENSYCNVGTILFGCLAALLHSVAIADEALAFCYPILGEGIEVKRWHG
jgi:hypothetical protein